MRARIAEMEDVEDVRGETGDGLMAGFEENPASPESFLCLRLAQNVAVFEQQPQPDCLHSGGGRGKRFPSSLVLKPLSESGF